MTCAHCGHASEPTTTVRGLAPCPACLSTLIVETGARATSQHTLGLSEAEVEALRALRKARRDARVPQP